ncbi:fibronectin type III domain-containing protein [bacterium]|nr:fibronectin type III domain-containing protein [bacterium]
MNRIIVSIICLMLVLGSCAYAANMTESMRLTHARTQEQLLKTVHKMALIQQVRPVMDLLQARKLFIDQILYTNEGQFKAELLSGTDRISRRLRSQMSWELLSSLPEARLYSLFTAADLGGYGDNEPPYEPSNPYPSNGATDVPRTVTLQWTGGDPNPGDMVYYDLYFGTEANPPLLAASVSVESYEVTSLDPGTQYYWQIVARDNWDAETEGQVWHFVTLANDPPFEPVNPIPPDGGTDIDLNANLSWQCNDPNPGDTLTFDVYFGTSSPPPLVNDDITEVTYDPGEMLEATTYYWLILARDSFGAETSGPEWSFTTLTGSNNPPYEPSNPAPANGDTNVDVNADISWDGGDPNAGDTVVYDIYFGIDPDPPVAVQNISDTTYDPGTLEQGRMYYWRIQARDNHSAETTGAIWNFITQMTDPTPTPPVETPTPEPCTEWSIDLDMGQSYFCMGDLFYLNANICNPGEPESYPVWVLLEIEGMFWFAPSFSTEVDYFFDDPIPSGLSSLSIQPEFFWPETEAACDDARFWGAITDTQYALVGDYDMIAFGWGPCD